MRGFFVYISIITGTRKEYCVEFIKLVQQVKN